MQRILGQVPDAGSSTALHENMTIISKIIFIYMICNVVPQKEGREKIAINGYVLVDEILRTKQVSLP